MSTGVPLWVFLHLFIVTFSRVYDEPGKELLTALEIGGQIERVPLSHKSKFCSRAFIVKAAAIKMELALLTVVLIKKKLKRSYSGSII